MLFDGRIISADQPVASGISRGLMYGEGVFDTLRLYSGKALFLSEHFDRLFEGLEVLGIKVREDWTHKHICSGIAQLLQEKNLQEADAIVRLQFWRDGNRGYRPDQSGTPHYMITASHCPSSFEQPHLMTVNRRRIPSQSLPSEYKFTNGIGYILAAREASQKGGDDALMQTISGWISETTIANIFWVRGDTIFTPSVECDLLPGITRNILIRLIKQQEQWNLKTGTFELADVLDAETVWICNSVRELLRVKAIDECKYNSRSAIFDKLKQQFFIYRDEHLKSL